VKALICSLCLGTAVGLLTATALLSGAALAAEAGQAAPTPPPLVLATSGTRSYTVKPGDTLLSIARAFGVSSSAIADANGLQDPNKLVAGMTLTIPGGQAAAPTATAGRCSSG